MSEIIGGIVHGAESLLSGAGHALFGSWLPRGVMPREPGQRASVRYMTLARCTEPGCAVRYRSGSDRPCAMHNEDGDTLSARMDAFTELSAVPGDRSADDGGDASADDGRSATDGRRQTANRHGIPRR